MYIGIDLGTSAVKTVLMDENESLIAGHSAAQQVQRPHDGWSEQDPAGWIAGIEAGFESLRQTNPDAFYAVRGIAVSGQMHGATLLDEADQVIRPCILWNDTRSADEARELDTDASRAVTGNILFPGFTAPKIAWVGRHEPSHRARVHRVLLPKDYANLWLTGEAVGEMSDASGTGWLDVGARAWSEDRLAAVDLGIEHMPRLVEGSAVAGTLRPALAERFGLGRAVVVAGGAGDNAASACGMGTVKPGSAFLSLGTSGVLFAANERFRPNADSAVHTFCHALPDTWHQMGVILAATDALNWLAALFDTEPASLTESLDPAQATPLDVTFLPYLGGERTPHNDPSIRGVLTGLGHATDREALVRAVLQGVAFAFADCRRVLRETGTSLDRIYAIGGGSRSDYWLQLLANSLSEPLATTVGGDFGAGLGAARLARCAADDRDPFEVCVPPPIARMIEPDVAHRDGFDAAYRRYRDTYVRLSG